MSNLNESILAKAPINTTHWQITTGRYLRTGNAVIDGYVNLNILRSLESVRLIESLPAAKLEQIFISCEPGANAFSLASGKYLSMGENGIRVISKNGTSPVQCPSEIKHLVCIPHIHSYLVNEILLHEKLNEKLKLSA
ncbi:hypothetical protein [Acinetobacter pittii]|uniref:hypothetical protein n=1 Tax=Acinetobacter pittii TaxID=48296 RepID=UPI002AFEE5AA|nr:hypothetical protein [Acinetobacter pittii]